MSDVLIEVKKGHLKRNYRQGVSGNNIVSRENPNKSSQASGVCRNAIIGLLNADLQKTGKVTIYH